MGQRFFIESPIAEDSEVALSRDEGRHLAKVMRAQIGDEIVLFDGAGSEFLATIERIVKGTVWLKILSRNTVDRELPYALTLGVALPRGDRQRWLIEKAVELGVTRVVPLITVRGVAQPTSQACQRLTRVVIESSKQCGRNRLLEICEPQVVRAFLCCCDTMERLFVHPYGSKDSLATVSEHAVADPLSPVAVAVGPEGGFTDDEVDAARELGCQLVDLGPRTLRIETAAVAICSYITLSRLAVIEGRSNDEG